MACNQILNGLMRDCQPSMGGIVEAHAINREFVKEITAADGQISAITLENSEKSA